jgi:hypothetical protein
MKFNNSSFFLSAAIAGILGAGMQITPVMAKDKAEQGLCKGANSCSGKSACGEVKGKNDCKGKGFATMTKAKCEKKKMMWMEAPKMNEKS